MKSLSISISSQPRARHDRASRSRQRAFPRTDYQFHAPAEDVVAVQDRAVTASRAELRSFRQISTDYLGEKTYRGYLVDFAVYALLTGLCVWSLIALGILVFQAMTA
ncbi:MAG: hypothetical protein ACR2NX_13565 [Chthoniobacterales bacterium]